MSARERDGGAGPGDAASADTPAGGAYPSPVGRLLRATVAKFLLAVFRTRSFGEENIPAGAAVLCGNHVSYMDPVLIWCGVPRIAHYMGKSTLWDYAFLRWILPRVWVFPVKREGADRTALATATRLLEQGELVGVFPEGTRVLGQEGLGEAHGGAALIALRAGAPIVPVGIAGTDRVWPRGRKLPRLARVTIEYGEPVRPERFATGSRKERVDAMTAEVMRRIAEELEAARRLHDAR